ncbi:mucin-binding protein [Lactovum odontotermitis]
MIYQHQKIKTNTHYKTWKKGKSWCYSFSILAALAGGIVLASQTVNADAADVAAMDTTKAAENLALPNSETPAEAPLENTESPVTDVAPELSSAESTSLSGTTAETPSTADIAVANDSPADDSAAQPAFSEPATFSAASSLDIQAVTADAVSSEVSLLKGQTKEEQPSEQSLTASASQRLGARVSFSAKTSDLIEGNTIVIARVSQTTTGDPEDLAAFSGSGSPATLKNDAGEAIGTVQYDSSLNAIVLMVTKTVTDPGDTQTYSVDAPWIMEINYNTPIPVQSKMPFSNTLTVSGKNSEKSYTFDFTTFTANDAIYLPGDHYSAPKGTAKESALDSYYYHEDIPDDAAFNELQDSDGGTIGELPSNSGVMKFYKMTGDSVITGVTGGIRLGNYYVSHDTGKIQSLSNQYQRGTDNGNINAGGSLNDAGTGLTLAELQAAATETGIYYSYQGNNSYYVVAYLSPEDKVLSDEEISENVRNSPIAATRDASDVEEDVQATLDYYHGALENRATKIRIITTFTWADDTIANTLTVQEVDSSGEAVGEESTSTSEPNAVDFGNTPVKIHYVDLNGESIKGTSIDTQSGAPTGKENTLNYASDASATTNPITVPGYTLVTNPADLTATQQEQLAKALGTGGTLEGLGLSSTDLDNVKAQSIFGTKTDTVPFPGFADTNYDADGHIVTDGGTAGYGQTDVYYFYVGNPQKVVYNIIDNNDPENPVTLDGKSNLNFDDGTSNANLNRKQSDLQTIADDYLTDHPEYAFDSIDPVPGSFDADDATNQVVNIYLKHAAVPVTGSKTVNEVIHYVYEDGSEAASDHTDQVTFTLTGATNDAVTGDTLTEGTWVATDDDNSFDAFDSPTLKGYTADQLTVDEVTGLSQDSTDTEFTVTYKANAQKVVYNVIDDTTGETLEDSADFEDGVTDGTLTKTKDDLQTIADGYVDKGYEIVSVDDVPVTFDNDDATDQIVNIHLKHGQEVTTGTREVDETIHYVYEDGSEAAPDKTDKVTFTQTTLTDKVTGEVISQTDWAAENDDTTFETVTSPEIDGYTSDKPTVDAVTDLTADSEDTEVTVTYMKDAEEPATTPEPKDDTPTTPGSTPKATLTAQPTSSTAKKSVLPSTGDEERSTVAAAGGLIVLGAGLLSVIRYLRRKKQ